MNQIKLNYIGFWDGFDKNNNLFSNILSEYFEVVISDNPDYIIASPLGEPLEYLKYDCVRILFTGEPLVPDFNVFDYAIGFDDISFPDSIVKNRYYRYPLCFYNIKNAKQNADGLTYKEAKEVLEQKKYFCNFIYGHQSANGEREWIFTELNKYKRVLSAGSYLNNMQGVVKYSEKKDFLKPFKFTIACESISYPGFVTEKLIHPLFSNSIPIYYGNPLVSREFNSKAMINLHDFPTIEEAIEYVKQTDQDDGLYIKMLMEPKYVSKDYLEKLYNGLKEFLFLIFSQNPQNAFRRMRYSLQREHENYLKEYMKFSKSFEYRIYKSIEYRRSQKRKNILHSVGAKS